MAGAMVQRSVAWIRPSDLEARMKPKSAICKKDNARMSREDEFLKNEPVRANLRENGDDCEAPRSIEHYAYFPTREGQAGYRNFVISRGYQVDREDVDSDEDGRLLIVFSQVQVPIAIDEETALLEDYAIELGGEYDGWVTDVVRPLQ